MDSTQIYEEPLFIMIYYLHTKYDIIALLYYPPKQPDRTVKQPQERPNGMD